MSCTPVFVLHMVVVMHAAAFNQCEQQQAAVHCRDWARGHRLALNPTARMAAAAFLLNTGCSTGIPSTYSKAGPVCNPFLRGKCHPCYLPACCADAVLVLLSCRRPMVVMGWRPAGRILCCHQYHLCAQVGCRNGGVCVCLQPAGYVDCAGPDRSCGLPEEGIFMVSAG